MHGGQPMEVARIGGSDRSGGGIDRVWTERGLLKVRQQYGVAPCCANYFETTSYRLRGKNLVAIGEPTREAAEGSAPIRPLQFQRGSTSATISGRFDGKDVQYSMRARTSQTMEIEPAESSRAAADIDVVGRMARS
jgi:hypothetical protein